MKDKIVIILVNKVLIVNTLLRPGIAVLFSILFTSSVFGQLGFYDGYIVTNQNDSILGKIGAYQNKQIIEYCILKKGDEDVKYYPNMIQRFGYDEGACYVSNVLKDTIIQVFVQGRLNLYKFQSTHLIQKGNDEVYRLTSKTEKVLRNGEMYYVEDIKWKGIVTYLSSDCNVNPNELKKMQLLDADLTKFVVNYNKCTKSDYIDYISKKRRRK